MVGRYLARRRVYAVSRYAPYARTAVNAARVGYSAARTGYNIARTTLPYVAAAYRARSNYRNIHSTVRRPPLVPAVKKSRAIPLKHHTRGRHTGKFSKAKKPSPVNTYLKYGSRKVLEYGGTVADDECVYIGHASLIPQEVALAFTRAVVRHLFIKAGFTFSDYEEPLPSDNIGVSAWEIYFSYAIGDGVPSIVNTALDPTTTTFGSMADKLAVRILALVEGVETIQFDVFRLVQVRYSAVAIPVVLEVDEMARLYAKGCNVQFQAKSKLTIQNRSLAAAVGADPDGYDAMNVSNNPIHGKKYLTTGTAFYPNTFALNGVAQNLSNNFAADNLEGMIRFGSTAIPAGTRFRKVQPSSVFQGKTNCTSVKLDPGEIKHSMLVFKMDEPINKFMIKMQNYYSVFTVAPTSSQKRVLTPGSVEMFAFEKLLDSRSDVQQISIGWEKEYSIECKISTKQLRTNPIIFVQPAP